MLGSLIEGIGRIFVRTGDAGLIFLGSLIRVAGSSDRLSHVIVVPFLTRRVWRIVWPLAAKDAGQRQHGDVIQDSAL